MLINLNLSPESPKKRRRYKWLLKAQLSWQSSTYNPMIFRRPKHYKSVRLYSGDQPSGMEHSGI